jgi:AcrR family transcriptional regulator
MAKKKAAVALNTEEKIKEAARKVFLQKGFSATRTRDIAEEAGINLALLNYYFRSKQKLFEVVMLEKVQKLLGNLLPLMNDASTSLESKIELIVEHYMATLSDTPDLPIFVLNEMRKKNFELMPPFPSAKIISESSFFKQLKERRKDINPLQLFITMLGMTIFPFVARPMLMHTGILTDKSFHTLMQERKKLISIWMKAIIKSK